MKALVTYYTETGNTEKLAHAIYEALNIDKEIKPMRDVKDVQGYDIVFYGFPVMAHSVPRKAQELIKELPKGQKIAFFSTHGSRREGHLPKQAVEHALGLSMHVKVLGHYGCRGKVPDKLLESLKDKAEHKAWVEEALSAKGHPDQNDLADARDFAVKMIAAVVKK